MLVWPSTLMQLKVQAAARRAMARRSVGSTRASVRTKASIVAMFGPIMAAPFARPVNRTSTPSITATRVQILMRVSVVVMAWAASSRAAGLAASCVSPERMPFSSGAIGKCRPMTPVEQTRTCSGRQASSSAATAVILRASSRPRLPVQALALPEQTTMPRASARGNRSWQTWTGAARTRFCVKTPAAAAGPLLTINARSRRPASGRTPQCNPAKRNPRARCHSDIRWNPLVNGGERRRDYIGGRRLFEAPHECVLKS